MKLHHVQVLCPSESIDAVRRFYTRILGLSEILRPSSLPPEGVWYELANGCQLHIGVLRDGDALSASRAHFALQVESLKAVLTRLDAEQIPYRERCDIHGWRRVQFRDPFGNGIEVVEIEGD